MAEVLPFSQPSTITMLHSRPSSSDAFQTPAQQYPPASRVGQSQRGMYNGQSTGYRGTAAPTQPYAFQSTPHLRQESRTISPPTSGHGPVTGLRHGHAQSASASTTSSDASSQPSAKDDSVMGSTRSVSAINLPWQLPDVSLPSFEQASPKSTPERYRRSAHKRVSSSGSIGTGNASNDTTVKPVETVDEAISPAVGQAEPAQTHRLRTVRHRDISGAADFAASEAAVSGHAESKPPRPVSMVQDAKAVDGEGLPQLNVDVPAVNAGGELKRDAAPQDSQASTNESNVEPKVTALPARASPQAARRTGAGPSPLSRQATESGNVTPYASPTKPKTYAAAVQSGLGASSPAAAHLAAVSDRDLNKGMKSRLRRAFSFGSAQELRKAGGESNPVAIQHAQMARQQHQQSIDDELDAEQLEIARRQEAAGFGAGIYSGQGGFTGSTDNLSISSTASSASMMLRKMGRGAKKSARSIKGLFRPKSVIGVPAADGPLQLDAGAHAVQAPSMAEVSMVTVEAERRNVNVNAHADELVGGGTGFPKLERNSIDASRVGDAEPHASLDGSDSRRSIVGSDRERAEVLAAVKKGILKRSATGDSPIIRPSDGPAAVSHLTESPSGSLPGTPGGAADATAAKGRSVSMTTAGDYFHLRGAAASARSLPATPNGTARSISFSPRIQFHDVWSRAEYDRRGEVATCNLLTPLLAQQIKEELNTFKMEMEVHELSKPHTHFF